MSIAICALCVAALAWALWSNPDICSPAKLFLLSFLVFHLGVLSVHGSQELWSLVLLVLLVGVLTSLFEALSPPPPPVRYPIELRRHADPRGLVLWLWALTAPAVVGQLYLIYKIGGLAAYVNALGWRVVEFRGVGWATTLSATMPALDLAYFAIGLTRTRSRSWWSLYLAHLLIAIALGLLSGSRSGLLTLFAMQLFCYHYLRARVRLMRALSLAAVLLFAALLLGVLRNVVRLEDGELSVGSIGPGNQTLAYGTFNYGVQPLEILLDADELKLAHGMTLVSVVTNVVPRDWWPDKPDTGGVFFTKEYTGNAWGGASNLTPTLLGEIVTNFGWVAGIALYALIYPFLMYLLVLYYRRVVPRADQAGGAAAAIELLLYVCVLWALVGVMIAEVTATVVGLFTTRIVPLLLLKAVLDLSPRTPRGRSDLPGAPLPARGV